MTNRNSKRYYWLKLNENFFEREEIKIIEDMKNGKDYIIFYMKLLLKSVGTEGVLKFRDVIPYTPEMLSSITNTDVDTVRVAIKMFTDLGLMDLWDDGTLFMAETQNMIGSETGWAKKKREQRDNVPLKKDNVPSLSPICPTEREKDIEIELEIDIEIEKEEDPYSFNDKEYKNNFKEIAQLYQHTIGQPNGLTSSWIKDSLKEYGFQWLKGAMIEAEKRGKRNKSYVEAILNNWKNDGGMKLGGEEDGTSRGNVGGGTSEVDRLKGIAIKEGLIGEDGTINDIGEIDY